MGFQAGSLHSGPRQAATRGLGLARHRSEHSTAARPLARRSGLRIVTCALSLCQIAGSRPATVRPGGGASRRRSNGIPPAMPTSPPAAVGVFPPARVPLRGSGKATQPLVRAAHTRAPVLRDTLHMTGSGRAAESGTVLFEATGRRQHDRHQLVGGALAKQPAGAGPLTERRDAVTTDARAPHQGRHGVPGMARQLGR